MILENGSKQCCGCSACADACPCHAIEMKPDREGFLYPVIDRESCTECGLCEKICPALELPVFHGEPKAYALQLKDEVVLTKSQSGGAFWFIAKGILEQGGVVYGAAFDENMKVVHKRAETKEEAEAFHGSKYVQTDMRGVMKRVKQDLQTGKPVLYTGTACHIAGLYRFLGKEYDNLYTCDLICHGVPTPMLLEKYFDYQKKKNGSAVTAFDVGYNAQEGYTWMEPRSERVQLKNGTKFRTNKYMRMFISNWCLRPYCHTCPYAQTQRVGDFTIGDCWGIEHYSDAFDLSKGVSVLFVNNEKAEKWVDEKKGEVILVPMDMEHVKAYQANLSAPSKANKRRELILDKLIHKGFLPAYRVDRFFYKLYEIKQRIMKEL